MPTARSLSESPNRLTAFIKKLRTQFFSEQANEFISLKELISQLRAKFFTQKAVAQRIGLDRTAIARYEDENRPEQLTFGIERWLFMSYFFYSFLAKLLFKKCDKSAKMQC